MSKSGQVATKADQGGQRVPKAPIETAGKVKQSPPTGSPAKPDNAKKPDK